MDKPLPNYSQLRSPLGPPLEQNLPSGGASVPMLLEARPNAIKTIDDYLLYSFLASSILWFNLLKHDLQELIRHCAITGLNPIQFRKKVNLLHQATRCLDVILMQCDIVHHDVVRSSPQLSFELNGSASDMPFLFDLVKMSEYLRDEATKIRSCSGVQCSELCSLSYCIYDKMDAVRQHFTELFSAIQTKQHVHEAISVQQLVEKKHILNSVPQVTTRTYEELTSATISQMFNVWLPTILTWIGTAIDLLMLPTPQVQCAERLLRRVALLLRLFEKTLIYPQAVAALGDGTEGISFRLLEVTLGQPDEQLVRYLKEANLMTDQIERQLTRPSLHEAFLLLLEKRNLASDAKQDIIGIPKSIMVMLTETGPHDDISWLSEAMIDVQQALGHCKNIHRSMIERVKWNYQQLDRKDTKID